MHEHTFFAILGVYFRPHILGRSPFTVYIHLAIIYVSFAVAGFFIANEIEAFTIKA